MIKTRNLNLLTFVNLLFKYFFCIVVCRGDDVVLIHDIVRVLAEENVVKDVANAARLHGVSLVGIKTISLNC